MTTLPDARRPLFVMGDIHGQYDRMVACLRDAELMDGDLAWRGGDAGLWFFGDFFDRGPDGIGVVELVMRLQAEAPRQGGAVHSLLGNHEPLLLAAHRFEDTPGISSGPGGTVRADWERNGGVASDLARLTPEIAAWLTTLPALSLVGNYLLVHADALFYQAYGDSIAEVNRNMAAVLQSSDPGPWDRLLNDFSERNAFHGADGPDRARDFLRTFGGAQIVHGHTPLCRQTGVPPETVTAPYRYADDLCLNVDGGLYLGGPGFVHRLA